MHILFAASEVAPYSKTGGLADVCGALPKALSRLGRKASIITPLYKSAREYFEKSGDRLIPLDGVTLDVRVGSEIKKAAVRRAKTPDSDVDVYFIEHDGYFYRDGLYNYSGVDFGDNCERFVFFSRAVLEAIRALNLDVDVVHANDWQTALVPVFLDVEYKSASKFDAASSLSTAPGAFFGGVRPRLSDPVSPVAGASVPQNRFDKIKSVLTIHNMRHQGRFWRDAMNLTGLDWKYFSFDKMEFYGQLNLLKSGLVFADKITTVSPQYSMEIQTPEYGEGLQGVLQNRAKDLSGILNGVDVENEWNPATDAFLTEPYARFDSETVFENKPKCKAALQAEMGLPVDPEAPLIGVVGRFDRQKGLDLILEAAGDLIEKENVQLAVLGTGARDLTLGFENLARTYRNNVAVQTRFSVELSHRIEAGSDMFLMPSRFEPCGLNQMYSQRYGTLPIVRKVGGLSDSVVNASDENIANGTATGFDFYWANAADMRKAIDWALHCYRDRRDDWNKIVRTTTKLDLSWNNSAAKYGKLYDALVRE